MHCWPTPFRYSSAATQLFCSLQKSLNNTSASRSKSSDDVLICKTNRVTRAVTTPSVTVTFDGQVCYRASEHTKLGLAVWTLDNFVQNFSDSSTTVVLSSTQATREILAPYSFKPNPNLTHISPLSSFHSGGRDITVRGANFHIIQKPMMFYKKDNIYRSNFTVRVSVFYN